jgi:hypothetical protein
MQTKDGLHDRRRISGVEAPSILAYLPRDTHPRLRRVSCLKVLQHNAYWGMRENAEESAAIQAPQGESLLIARTGPCASCNQDAMGKLLLRRISLQCLSRRPSGKLAWSFKGKGFRLPQRRPFIQQDATWTFNKGYGSIQCLIRKDSCQANMTSKTRGTYLR